MTIYCAELIFQGDELGSIEVGKLADFAVLEKDPTAMDFMEIKDIGMKETYIGGKSVFE